MFSGSPAYPLNRMTKAAKKVENPDAPVILTGSRHSAPLMEIQATGIPFCRDIENKNLIMDQGGINS
jgi:hypothetical protein